MIRKRRPRVRALIETSPGSWTARTFNVGEVPEGARPVDDLDGLTEALDEGPVPDPVLRADELSALFEAGEWGAAARMLLGVKEESADGNN